MFINCPDGVKPLRLKDINLVLVYLEKRGSAQHWNKMNLSASSGSGVTTGCEGRIFDSKSTQARAITVILIITNIITAPVTSLLNGLVIVAVKTKLRLRSRSNIALACLATTDCFMGVIGQPIFIAANIAILQAGTSNTYCFIRQLSMAVLTVLVRASLLHLALMYLDRYIAIKHPYRYTNMVTATRILCSSACAWSVALLSTATSRFLNDKLYQPLTDGSIIAFFCTIIITFSQIFLYYETRRHEKQIAAHQVSEDDRKKFAKEKKALKLTTTVLFFLLLTYCPVIVVGILIKKTFFDSLNAAHIALAIASFLVLLNSFINPVIYCIRRRQFRIAFIEILFRKSNLQAQEIEMRVNGARKGLGWRSQNNEQESVTNNTNSNPKN